jgi:hypothetical protein
MRKPATLDNLYELFTRAEKEGSDAIVVFLVQRLTSVSSERKLLKKISLAKWRQNIEGFSKGLLEARTKKAGKEKARQDLLEELKALQVKTDGEIRELLKVAHRRQALETQGRKAAIVRHNGGQAFNINISKPLKNVIWTIEAL